MVTVERCRSLNSYLVCVAARMFACHNTIEFDLIRIEPRPPQSSVSKDQEKGKWVI
jgi:hypothetical protein